MDGDRRGPVEEYISGNGTMDSLLEATKPLSCLLRPSEYEKQ